jgi:hypothetical protein
MKVFKQIYGYGKMVLPAAIALLLLQGIPLRGNYLHTALFNDPPGITCPGDIETVNDPGQCYAVVDYTPPDDAYLESGLASGSNFPIGITVITFKSNDETHTCSFTVTVTDSEPPEIFFPGNIVQSSSSGDCQVVNFEPPYAVDNCELVSFVQVSGLEPGDIFPAGTTVNTYEATDAAGNTSTGSFSVTITGNSSAVLHFDGSTSQLMAPQGGVAYQRSFYLISPEEMADSDLTAGTEINSIGFTIGVASESEVSASLKVYLQNTSDEESRFDTTWAVVTTSQNHYTLSDLAGGDYEWQVSAVCSGNTPYSTLENFSTVDLNECGQPYNLETTDITFKTATFTWEGTQSKSIGKVSEANDYKGFLAEYSIYPFETWIEVFTTDTFYHATNLIPDENYRWRVKNICTVGESLQSESSFTTESLHLCNNPSGLAVGGVGNTIASFSWNNADSVQHYRLDYRRVGTPDWFTAISMGDSITISGLASGTTYEWSLRTKCENGHGVKVSGPDFTTTGAAVCYPPEGLKTTGIGVSAATLTWLETPGAVSYEIRYRLKESISWENVIEPMTLVSDGSLTLPNQIGGYDIPFTPEETFIYDGNGLYVALEFSNPSGELTDFNTVLSTKQNTSVMGQTGLDSLKIILAFDGRNHRQSASFPSTLRATDVRPETRLGSPVSSDMVEVAALYTLGKVALPYGNPVPVSARVRNFTADPVTLPVLLQIISMETGDIRHTETIETEVPAYCSDLVTFSDWTPSETGMDSIVVSVPVQSGENVIFNNSQYVNQLVNRVIHSYDDDTPTLAGAGFGDEEGLILSRFRMNGCGTINSVRVNLHWSSEDYPLYAVLLDEDGNILDTSPSFTPDKYEINNYHTFFFQNPQLILDSDYYVGIAQQAVSGESYYPVGVQWEGSKTRDGAYYRADLAGSNLISFSYPGRLMMQVEILPSLLIPFISGAETLCEGGTITLQAASKTVRYANKVISASSEQTPSKYGAMQVLGSPDVYPEYTQSPKAWMSETPDGQREFLELQFPNAAPINFIDIYQVLNPGAIDTVRVKDDMGQYHIVYAEEAQAEPNVASIKKIRFPATDYPVSEIRIELASDSVAGFNLIDAVAIGKINETDDVFDNYLWYPGMQTSPSIEVNTPGKYFLTATTADNCALTDSITVITPDLTIPVISLSGPADFCQGSSVVLTSSQEFNNTWSTGETTESITVNTSGSYSVTYFDGCQSTTSSSVEITVYPLPDVNITGGPMCPGSTTVLDAGSGFQSYLWSTGDSIQSISVNASGFYSVTVIDNNGCSGSGSVQAFLVPDPTPSILGNPYFCPGDSSLLDAGGGYASYLWSTGATTRSVYVETAGLVSVTVTDSYGCQGTSSITTGEYVPPQPAISGTLSFCAGASTVLDVGSGYSAYLWSTGATSRAIFVSEAGTYGVTVTDGNGCEGTAGVDVAIEGSSPEVPGPISGPTEGLCNLSEVNFSLEPLLNTTHYVWTVPEGMTIIEGQGTNSITAEVFIFSSGIVSVAASNKCGQSPTWNGRTLFVKGAPEMPMDIVGQADGVCGLSGVGYSVPEVFGATSYSWIVPEGVNIISGNGTSSIYVSFGPSFVSGNICVSAVNDCGASGFRCFSVNGSPETPVQIFGPDQVCRRANKVSYSINPVAHASSYTWVVPHMASIFSGQGTTSIVVDFGNWPGNISVFATNSCGNSDVQYLAVDVINCSPQEIETNKDSQGNNVNLDPNQYSNNGFAFFPEVIGSSGGSSDEFPGFLNWTLGEAVIETIRDVTSILTQGFQQSLYQLNVTDNHLVEYAFTVEVYPVPTRNFVSLRVRSTSENPYLFIELIDLVGTPIFRQETREIDSSYQINLSHLPPGVFILSVVDMRNHQQRFFKVIKI